MSGWIDVETARTLPGLRLVLTTGVPGPWGEAAKGMFAAKGIAFARATQDPGRSNDALHEWTGHRNAPVAVYEDEPARAGWAEILLLAERLAPEPRLIPEDPALRAMMFGLCHELMGEWGFGWCRRLLILRENLGDADEPPEPMRAAMGRMLRDYGFRPAAVKDAPPRVAEILRMLSLRLASQRAAGHRFLMGARVSALDIHWAAMAALVAPLPEEVCAMPAMVRDLYGRLPEEARAALDPALLEHRDAIYRDFMELPVRL